MRITVTGRSLFDEMLARITGIDLNPRSRAAVSFEARHFEVIQQTAQGMILDDILHGRSARPDRYPRLRRFAGYRLPSRVTNGINHMMLAPDASGLRLAPVFTTKDAAEAFTNVVLEREGSPPAMGRYDGKTLFKHLASANLDGILFNPFGPGTPRQMPPDFARLVLERDLGE